MLTILSEPNVLILDEPTNDVDTDMLAATEDLLDSWPGTLIVVSHDRYLLERVTDQQYAILDGHLRHLPGGVDEYLRLAAAAAAPGRHASRRRPRRPEALSGAELRNMRERDLVDRAVTGQTGRPHHGQAHRAGRARSVRPCRNRPADRGIARAGGRSGRRTGARWLELSERIE